MTWQLQAESQVTDDQVTCQVRSQRESNDSQANNSVCQQRNFQKNKLLFTAAERSLKITAAERSLKNSNKITRKLKSYANSEIRNSLRQSKQWHLNHIHKFKTYKYEQLLNGPL